MKKNEDKYTTPELEVIEVELEASIAASANGVSLWEELWG